MTVEPAPMAAGKEHELAKADAEGTVVADAATAGLPPDVASEESKPKVEDTSMKEAQKDAEGEDASSGEAGSKLEGKSVSFREESNCLSDLKEYEKKALLELRALLEEAIVGNKLFKKNSVTVPVKKGDGEKKSDGGTAPVEKKGVSGDENKVEETEMKGGEKSAAEAVTENESVTKVPQPDATSTEDNTLAETTIHKPDAAGTGEKPVLDSETLKSDAPAAVQASAALESDASAAVQASAALESDAPASAEQKAAVEALVTPKSDTPAAEEEKSAVGALVEPKPDPPAAEEEKSAVEAVVEPKPDPPAAEEETPAVAPAEPSLNKDISLWGVPLLPSKNEDATNVILLKFLRARDFRPKDALEMLSHTLAWRASSGIDTILEDATLGAGLDGAAYMDDGVDREGHPICYNVYGVFQDADLYQRTFGSEEKTEQFLRWRFQLMEKGIKRLDFRPGGTASILQVTDLKNAPGVSKKELRVAMKRAVGLLQDNYPEFVARNIFINVPFWYYAFNALLSPFLTQRTKSKFVFTRPSRVTETLLRYVPAETVPLRYGGLRRDGDEEFQAEDGGAKEVAIRGSSIETIELPAPEVGTTLLWDLTVLGWEVTYKEEFVPDDEGSYTVIVQKGRKMAATNEPLRNSFRTNEPGKIVLTIENNTFKRKKALYRYKIKNTGPTTSNV